MRSSRESLNWYNKINTLWESEGFPIRFASRREVAEKVNYKIAKQVWRKAFRQEYPKFKGKLIFEKETSGNRYTVYSKAYNDINVWINTSKGWSDLAHDLGHCIHYYKCRCFTGEQPHNANHATIEWRITKMIFEGGYIAKSRLEDAIEREKPKKDIVAANFKKLTKRKESLLVKEKKYITNLKRIRTSLKEVDKKINIYKKRYDSKRFTND